MPVLQMIMHNSINGPVVNLIDHTFSSSRDPNDVPPPALSPDTITVSFNSSGTLTVSSLSSGGVTRSPAIGATEWLDTGNASDCDIFVSVSVGTMTSGTYGAWTSLSATQQYKMTMPGTGTSKTATIDVQIRDTNTLSVLDTCSITLVIS